MKKDKTTVAMVKKRLTQTKHMKKKFTGLEQGKVNTVSCLTKTTNNIVEFD